MNSQLTTLMLRLDASQTPTSRSRRAAWLGSSLQGFLMQTIDPADAEILHKQGSNPYRAYCIESASPKAALDWVVTAFTESARKAILQPLLEPSITEVSLTSMGSAVYPVIEKTLTSASLNELAKIFYAEPCDRSCIEFLTPTAFRSAGSYVFHPDIRLFFQNLSMRYAEITEGEREPDDDLLDELVRHTRVVSYNLRSLYHPVGGAKIPGFTGVLHLRHEGSLTLRAYANLLLNVANHIGVGIKTAMGMGAVQTMSHQNKEATNDA